MGGRRRNRPGLRRCVAALLAVLLALPAAPISAARRGCDRCPPACPMHRKTERLGCHSARGGTPHCTKRLGLSAPGCSRAHEASVVAAVRALAARPLTAAPLVARPAPRPRDATAQTRAADPPEPPPPRASLLS